MFWLIIILFPLLCFLLHKIKNIPKWSIITLFSLLIALRLYLSTTIAGYQIDFGWATNWCLDMLNLPLREVYDKGFHVNYQPFGLILYGITGLIGKIFHTLPALPDGIAHFYPWTTTLAGAEQMKEFTEVVLPRYGNTVALLPEFAWQWVLTFKLIPLACDMGLAYIAFRLAKKYSTEKIGIIVATLMLLCPAMAIDSVFWGQLDSPLTLLLVLSIIYLAKIVENNKTKDWVLASVFFTLAILVKPQAIFFTPLFFAVLIKKFDIKNIAIAIGTIIALAFLICLPFGKDLGWLIKQIADTANQYHSYSNNAYNIFPLLKMSGSYEVTTGWSFYKLFIPLLITLATAYLFYKSTKKPIVSKKKKDAVEIKQIPPQGILFLLGGIGMLALFCIMPEMHERYSYPALIMFYLAYACMPNKWLLPVLPALSISIFANCTGVGAFFFYDGNTQIWQSLYATASRHSQFFSLLFLLTLCYSLFLTYKLLFQTKNVKVKT